MKSYKRSVWLFNAMGHGNQLLYWESLLKEFVLAFPQSEFHTSKTQARIKGTSHEVKASISRIKLGFKNYGISIPSPFCIYRLLRSRPDLIVISEFNIISFYAAVYRLLNKRVRLLILVENDPVFLENFYQIKRRNRLHNLYRKFIVARADRVLCNNKKTAGYLANDLGVDQENLAVGCYLTSELRTAPSNKNRTFISFLFVGRLEPGKGVHLLIEAIKSLPESARSKIEINVVGDGSEHHNLKQMASKLNLANIVRFHGHHPYESLGSFFANADVFIFPTLGDYRSLVTFEAISAGLPIIGSIYDGASEETICEGKNGFKVDPRNTQQLAEKINLLINNPNLVETFSKNSKRRSLKFSTSVAAGNIIKAAQACLEKPQGNSLNH